MRGDTIGQYRIADVIGSGGMGVVYSAEHTLIGRAAAVKVLLPEFSQNPAIVQRFFNEAKAATAIRHPGIVEILDFGWHTDGSAYIVMEHLDGETLTARRKRAQLTWQAILAITRQIAGALGAAHRKGIVHRDLKPDNVFIVADPEVPGGERIKLLDFGIAKLGNDQTGENKTRTGAVLGTPTYMAPEQCRGVTVDHRADLYSLGVVMFILCTGRAPFAGEGSGDVLAAHIYLAPPSVASLVPTVPAPIDALVTQLLAKSPADRPQTAEEVIARIDAAMASISNPYHARVQSSPSLALPAMPATLTPTTLSGAATHTPVPYVPPSRRGRTVMIAALAAVTIGSAIIAFALHDRAVAMPAALPAEPILAVTSVHPTPLPADPAPTALAVAPPPVAPKPASVELAIATTPAGAEILREGKQLGVTPFHGTLPASDAAIVLTLRKTGYIDNVISVVPNAAVDKSVTLSVRPRASPPHTNRDQSVNPFD